MDSEEKKSLIQRMNARSLKSFAEIALLDDAELSAKCTILSAELKEIELFTIPGMKADFRRMIELMKERGIKKVVRDYDPTLGVTATISNHRKPKSNKKRMTREERIRERGVESLMSVGMSRKDAEAQFGVKS